MHGSWVADALAMPVHWYYDRAALLRDYGVVDRFLPPRNPHPDSILWRSKLPRTSEKYDILRDQAQYWGRENIHYHQFLKAGENTLNFRLARELYSLVRKTGDYDKEAWLDLYIARMLEPGWHNDTYIEECHREFFSRLARGTAPAKCGIADGHIGGLAHVPALVAALEGSPLDEVAATVRTHVSLTHNHPGVLRAADTLTRLLHAVASESLPLREAIHRHAADWLSSGKAATWENKQDLEIVGRKFSPACYIDQAMPASLFLAWKYHENFSEGVTANAMCGGDNCHRGAVVGSLLGAACGVPKHLRLPHPDLTPSSNR